MGAISILLAMIACVCAVGGFVSMSQAPLDVGALALACFLGILAMLAQAAAYQQELRTYLVEEAP